MKSTWPLQPLAHICEFHRGLTYSKSNEIDFSDNIVLRANNIDLATNTLNFSELKYIEDSVVVPAAKKARKDSILICTASGSKSHLGKAAYIDDDYGYAFGGFMGQLTPNSSMNGRYLFHALTTPNYKDFIRKLSDGANINNLKFDDLKQFTIPVPPLPEQRRIVAILDAAFAAIATARAHTEQNLRNARELFESQLAAVFSQRGAGWEIKQFDDVLEIRNGKNQTSVESSDGQYPIFGSAGKVMGYATDFLCEAGTTIIGRKGTINSPIFSDTKFWNVDTAFGLSPKPRLDAKFLYYFCLSYDFNLHNRGTTIPSLVKTDLLQISIPVPPLPEQRHIVEKLDAAKAQSQTLQSLAQRKLAALDELKQSLLQQAFSGQL